MIKLFTLLLLTSILSAQEIKVKYRPTPVDIDNAKFTCANTDSSLVYGACYDKSNKYMLINLKGTWYHYCGMPSHAWRSFTGAESLGRHYGKRIRGNWDCRVGFVPEY